MRIVIVDDHDLIREGLRRILVAADPGWQVQAVASGHEALQVLREGWCDVAIIDLSMPGMGGLDLIKRVHDEHPKVPMLVLSMHAEERYAMRAFKAGAKGYVTKDAAASELVEAVRRIATGGAFVTASLAERVVMQLNRGGDERPAHEALTDRELEILRRMASGERLTDIGHALHLSVKTVSTHKSRILEKLQLANLAALVRYALEHGLVDAGERAMGAAPDEAHKASGSALPATATAAPGERSAG